MNNGEFNIIINSMINYVFCTQSYELSDEQLKHLCKVLDYPSIDDRYLTDNPNLYKYIQWDRLEKMQAVRVAARNKKLLDVIDLKKHQYRIREIFFLIKNNFNLLFTHFNFDFDKLSQDDAYFLLCLGEQSFWPMVDTNKYKFSFIEAFDIMKAYQFNRSVVTALNYKVLKSYQIAEVFIITGEEFLDLFDTDVLTTLDWLNVLVYQPKFIYKCDFDKFLRGDPFNLIQLIVLFDSPDLSYLIDQIDKNKITAFGWERLLIGKPDRFKDICDYKKLNEANWLVISQEAPELLSYKP